MSQSNWIFAFASTIGNSHIKENIPCQDFCNVVEYGEFNIAIVADGAGSCEYSHLGAKHAVEFANFHFSHLIKNNQWGSENIPTHELWHSCSKECFSKVYADLQKLSINSSVELKSLSCTLIVVVSYVDFLLVTHVGDGRAGYCDANFKWGAMIIPFKGEEANQTVFVTSDIYDPSIIDNYIHSNIIVDDIIAFCLMTDGCEKSAYQCNLFDEENNQFYDPNLPFPDFFNRNIEILKQLANSGKSQDEINTLWESFLIKGTDKLKAETDDKTLILAVR